MTKVKLTEGILDRFMKNVEKRVRKRKMKNAKKVVNDPKFKRELVDFMKSLDSLEDSWDRIGKKTW